MKYINTIVPSVLYWIKNQHPTVKKAKSLRMTKKQYAKEYITLVNMKIAGLKNEIADWARCQNQQDFTSKLLLCIEILEKELKKKYK